MVNIYDFDGTIYKGDGMVDFYLFCLRKNPRLITYLPGQLWHILRFVLKIEDRTTVKQHFFKYLNSVSNAEKQAELFWKKHRGGIKAWYSTKDHSQDVIISASPQFLVQPIFDTLKAYKLIATIMDPKTGKISGQNCYGQEKVRRFTSELPDTEVAQAYGDRASDLPIMALAKEQFMVKGNTVTKL